jgi:hypothetical protein
MSVKLIAGLVLAGLLVLFAVQNAEPVEFRFLIWTFALSRGVDDVHPAGDRRSARLDDARRNG